VTHHPCKVGPFTLASSRLHFTARFDSLSLIDDHITAEPTTISIGLCQNTLHRTSPDFLFLTSLGPFALGYHENGYIGGDDCFFSMLILLRVKEDQRVDISSPQPFSKGTGVGLGVRSTLRSLMNTEHYQGTLTIGDRSWCCCSALRGHCFFAPFLDHSTYC